MMWAVVSRVGDILQLIGLVTVGVGIWKASGHARNIVAAVKAKFA